MKQVNNNQKAFFALVRAGLWEKDIRLSQSGQIDFGEVYRLAEAQSVVGLVTAGLDHISDTKPPKASILSFIGTSLRIEQRNVAMNKVLSETVTKMKSEGIYSILVKGQGVAQCYERPLWRSCGDIDFYFNEDQFLSAREYFRPLVSSLSTDVPSARNIAMKYKGWDVELHANQHTGLSGRIDGVLDDIHKDIFVRGQVRSCEIEKTQILLPSIENDILISFTHYLKHFYKGGLGLRQICDWCRLLWTYGDTIDLSLIERRLKEMGLMNEWRTFAAYAVEYLGMPKEALPLYVDGKSLIRKTRRINRFILSVGNMGHSRDNRVYGSKSFILRKTFSLCRRISDLCNHFMIFPLNSFKFFPTILINGLSAAAKGIGRRTQQK